MGLRQVTSVFYAQSKGRVKIRQHPFDVRDDVQYSVVF